MKESRGIRVYTISEAATMTKLTSHTLRYYEKLGLIPSPKRDSGGNRLYDQSDIEFIQFIFQLKKTGMSLDEIKDFTSDGCIAQQIKEGTTDLQSIEKRIDILSRHVEGLKEQQEQILHVINMTQHKLSYYKRILNANSRA